MLRYLTSGESHGRCMVAILEGIPQGLAIDKRIIDRELSRRMFGYGRGKRMRIESDKIEILSGLRKDRTIGSPIAMMVKNIDHSIDRLPLVLNPRPGHADLSGVLKYGVRDIRDVLERSSARDTVSRVAVGAICRILLKEFGIRITSHVISIGGIEANAEGLSFDRILALAETSPVRCADSGASQIMCRAIDDARADGETLGGIFEVIVNGVVSGIGGYAQWDKRIDAALAKAVISVQAVKAVGFGRGFEIANLRGSTAHDEIFYDRKRRSFYRKTNNAGGIEGGMTNGEDIVIRAAMKPIPTLMKCLSSVNIRTKKTEVAAIERSDVCAVPAAGVIGENVSAIEIASAFVEKFGGDSLKEMRRNYEGYVEQLRRF